LKETLTCLCVIIKLLLKVFDDILLQVQKIRFLTKINIHRKFFRDTGVISHPYFLISLALKRKSRCLCPFHNQIIDSKSSFSCFLNALFALLPIRLSNNLASIPWFGLRMVRFSSLKTSPAAISLDG